MAHSSLIGPERAVLEPARRDTGALGPGNNSDSGSDRVGLDGGDGDDPDLAFIDRAAAGDAVDGAIDGADQLATGLGDEDDNIPGAHPTPRGRPFPSQNPAPDRPENPGLPGDDDEAPADSAPGTHTHAPGRASGR